MSLYLTLFSAIIFAVCLNLFLQLPKLPIQCKRISFSKFIILWLLIKTGRSTFQWWFILNRSFNLKRFKFSISISYSAPYFMIHLVLRRIDFLKCSEMCILEQYLCFLFCLIHISIFTCAFFGFVFQIILFFFSI